MVYSRKRKTIFILRLNEVTIEFSLCTIVFYCRRVDTTNLQEIESAIGPKTKIVWLESPTNPRQMITDIKVSHNKAVLEDK